MADKLLKPKRKLSKKQLEAIERQKRTFQIYSEPKDDLFISQYESKVARNPAYLRVKRYRESD